MSEKMTTFWRGHVRSSNQINLLALQKMAANNRLSRVSASARVPGDTRMKVEYVCKDDPQRHYGFAPDTEQVRQLIKSIQQRLAERRTPSEEKS